MQGTDYKRTFWHPLRLRSVKPVQCLAKVVTAAPVTALHPVSLSVSRWGQPWAMALNPWSRTCSQPYMSRTLVGWLDDDWLGKVIAREREKGSTGVGGQISEDLK
jgi:hypothetical protein